MAQQTTDRSQDSHVRNTMLTIILALGSLMLIAGSIYILKELAILYGVGEGAVIQSISDNSNVSASLTYAATQLPLLHRDILESYALFLLSLGISGASFIMFIRRYDRGNATISQYTMLHLALTIVYLLLLYFVISDFYTYLQSMYIYTTYAGIAICIMMDIALEYNIRYQYASKTSKTLRALAIDPSKPFSNLMALQDGLFSKMSGSLKIIDKHFNSAALANLHRLTGPSVSNFNKITILTSKEMLDSSFWSNSADFRSELRSGGIGVEIRLMDDKDAVDQHERMLLDDSVAYKIPPFNIINKKSEHITRINHGEASSRFDYLYSRALKMENYAVKNARTNGVEAPNGDQR